MQNVGIIGLGAVSGHHLRATKSVATAQLVAVADINKDVLVRVLCACEKSAQTGCEVLI